MKNIKPYLLGSCICASAIVLTLTGIFYQKTVYSGRSFHAIQEPPVSATMLAIKDGSLLTPFMPECCVSSAHINTLHQLSFVDSSMLKIEPLEKHPLEFTRVGEDYFKDAVFIGDSRTAGIELYAGFKDTTFYATTSLNIFDFDKRKLNIDGNKMTIKEALSEHQFKKIYIMIGINDVGISTVDTFYNTYSEVVKEIMRLQPEAIIFIEANLHVTEKKSSADKNINNENIEIRNKKIASLADGERIFYIDVNDSSLCDEDGNLLEEYTWDQVHLEAKYYPIWKQFIMEHGIVLPDSK